MLWKPRMVQMSEYAKKCDLIRKCVLQILSQNKNYFSDLYYTKSSVQERSNAKLAVKVF